MNQVTCFENEGTIAIDGRFSLQSLLHLGADFVVKNQANMEALDPRLCVVAFADELAEAVCFYGAPESLHGSITLASGEFTEEIVSDCDDQVSVNFACLPENINKLLVAVTMETPESEPIRSVPMTELAGVNLVIAGQALGPANGAGFGQQVASYLQISFDCRVEDSNKACLYLVELHKTNDAWVLSAPGALRDGGMEQLIIDFGQAG